MLARNSILAYLKKGISVGSLEITEEDGQTHSFGTRTKNGNHVVLKVINNDFWTSLFVFVSLLMLLEITHSRETFSSGDIGCKTVDLSANEFYYLYTLLSVSESFMIGDVVTDNLSSVFDVRTTGERG